MNGASIAAIGRIGPNAVTRVAQALSFRLGDSAAEAVFARAGLSNHLLAPPQDMVDEEEVRLLHMALRELLSPDDAEEIARDAGHRTADYLLAHRIPAAAQAVLRRLPAALAAHLLLRAISRHAWTFCGSGRFRVTRQAPAAPPGGSPGGAGSGGRPMVEIRGNPLCRGVFSPLPACGFYAATFERLFRVLVHPRTRVLELSCEAMGADACRFTFDWT